MSKFSNILRMIILLKSRGKMKVQELAQELEVKERMVRTYRDDLELAGIYVESTKGIYGGYELKGYDYLTNLAVSDYEYSALSMAKEDLKNRDFVYIKEIEELFEKINIVKKENSVESVAIDYLEKESREINNDLNKRKHADIHAAIISKSKIEIKYFSPETGESLRVIRPYAIINYKGSLYIAAYCEKRNKMRDFKISRIKEYTILKEKYEIPKDFSLKDYMKGSLGLYKDQEIRLKLKIEKPMSYIISEKQWVENQKITWNEDESIFFEAAIRGKVEIKSWILSMGSSAAVVEPKELGEEIVEEMRRIIERNSL